MDNRKKFLTKLSQDNPTRLEQAIALLWYYNVKQEYEERSASDLVSDLEEDSFGRPNITKLRTGLKKSKLTVSGSRPDTFRINAAHFSELSKKYGHLINFIETEVTSSVLPIESFQGKRIYLERMVNQINGSYDYGFYDACAVMIRRLMESLIIEIFFNKNRVSEIKSNNVIISLDKLINKVINDNQIHLGRNTPKGMNFIKDLGDTAAHDSIYITRKEDIDDNKNNIRKTINELLVLAGILK